MAESLQEHSKPHLGFSKPYPQVQKKRILKIILRIQKQTGSQKHHLFVKTILHDLKIIPRALKAIPSLSKPSLGSNIITEERPALVFFSKF